MELISLLLATLFVAPPVLAEPDPEPGMGRDAYSDALPFGAVARYGTLRYRGGFAGGVAFSRDGKTVISAGAGNNLHFWETDTGKLVRKYEAFSSYNPQFAVSPDRKLILTGNWNEHELSLRDLETGKIIRRLTGLKKFPGSLQFSPDGKIVAACDYHVGSAVVWNATTGKLLARLQMGRFGRSWQQEAFRLAFSRNGKYLAVGHREVMIFEVATWKHVSSLQGFDASIESIAFITDDSQVITGADDRTLRLWDRRTGKQIRRIAEGAHGSFIVTRDGKTVIGSDMQWRLTAWDVETGKKIYRASTDSFATGLTLSDDGTRIAGHYNQTVLAYDAQTGKCLTPMLEALTDPRMVAFSPNGKFLAIAYGGNDYRLWNIQSGQVSRLPKMDIGVSWAIRVNEAQEVFVFGSMPKTGLETWNLTAKRRIASLPNEEFFSHASFARDGRVYASSNELIEWNPWANRIEWRRPLVRKGASRNLLLSADDRILLTWGDGEVKSWSAVTGKELSNLTLDRRDHPLALSPDGKHFLTTGDSGTHLREMRAGESAHDFAAKQVRSAAFSPDGRLIAVSDGFGAIQIWDAKSMKRIRRISGHRDVVTNVLFSPDSRYLASVSIDTTVLVWDVRKVAPGGK